MLAYIPYMDPMGKDIYQKHPKTKKYNKNTETQISLTCFYSVYYCIILYLLQDDEKNVPHVSWWFVALLLKQEKHIKIHQELLGECGIYMYLSGPNNIQNLIVWL
jgi:hypothetical protein